MKWEKVNLGEIAEFKNGLNFSNDQYGKGVKYISVADFKDYFSAKTESLAELKADFISPSYYLQEGDILFVRSNGNKELVGRNLFIQDSSEPLTFSGFCIRARFIKDDILPKFYAYLFKSKFFRNTLSANAGGTNINNLNQGILSNLNVTKPPLPTQHRITSILSAYDDLIENNLKRIKLLEEKAQLYYHELIILGKTESKTFEEFCMIIHGYAFKSNDFTEDKTNDIVVRMGNFKEGGGVQFENNTKYLNENFEYNPKYKLEPNDLVMVLSDVTREGRIIGNVGFVPSDAKIYLLNQRVGKIVSDEKYKYWLYVTFNGKTFKDYCLSCANSATVLNFNNKDLFKFNIQIPFEKELKAFSEKVKPIFNLMSNLVEQNTKLREARDILLPRLISGEIEV